jgi:hypothetical protein
MFETSKLAIPDLLVVDTSGITYRSRDDPTLIIDYHLAFSILMMLIARIITLIRTSYSRARTIDNQVTPRSFRYKRHIPKQCAYLIHIARQRDRINPNKYF